MDQLSDVFRSMRIQGAAYKRLEATAPWGVRYSGDIGTRVRFGLVVRGWALLTFKNQCQTISLSGGDVFIFILNDEPFPLVENRGSTIVDRRVLEQLAVGGVLHY